MNDLKELLQSLTRTISNTKKLEIINKIQAKINKNQPSVIRYILSTLEPIFHQELQDLELGESNIKSKKNKTDSLTNPISELDYISEIDFNHRDDKKGDLKHKDADRIKHKDAEEILNTDDKTTEQVIIEKESSSKSNKKIGKKPNNKIIKESSIKSNKKDIPNQLTLSILLPILNRNFAIVSEEMNERLALSLMKILLRNSPLSIDTLLLLISLFALITKKSKALHSSILPYSIRIFSLYCNNKNFKISNICLDMIDYLETRIHPIYSLDFIICDNKLLIDKDNKEKKKKKKKKEVERIENNNDIIIEAEKNTLFIDE